MPSIFTIQGTSTPPRKSKKPRSTKPKSKRSKKALGDAGLNRPDVGYCKTVNNPRTGCSMKLCYIGVGARTSKGKRSKTGWAFQEGSSSCRRR